MPHSQTPGKLETPYLSGVPSVVFHISPDRRPLQIILLTEPCSFGRFRTYGLHFSCLRLAHFVTSTCPRLGIRLLVRYSLADSSSARSMTPRGAQRVEELDHSSSPLVRTQRALLTHWAQERNIYSNLSLEKSMHYSGFWRGRPLHEFLELFPAKGFPLTSPI